jgi:ppGpp synthetase/RelA/SpoT-type nucleotidyltranferase
MKRSSRTPKASLPDLLDRMLPKQILPEQGFARWFEPWRQRVMVAVTEVHGAVTTCLDEEKARIRREEGLLRNVWSVTGTDGRSLLKSAASARSKIGRELRLLEKAGHLPKGRMSLDQIENMLLDFPDLGRFRVVCDFSCDVERAKSCLVHKKPPSLLGRYPLKGRIKDYVHDLNLRHPARGHRAFQFAAQVPIGGRSLLIEIQLMTLLQAAWDTRNHPIYEWSRDGGELPVDLTLLDVALAESLHLVDHQATQNWQKFLRLRKRAGGDR